MKKTDGSDDMRNGFDGKASPRSPSKTEAERRRTAQKALETFDRVAEKAQANGLTEEILEEIMDEYYAEKYGKKEGGKDDKTSGS